MTNIYSTGFSRYRYADTSFKYIICTTLAVSGSLTGVAAAQGVPQNGDALRSIIVSAAQQASSTSLGIGAPPPIPPPVGGPIPEPVPGGLLGPPRTPQSLRWTENWGALRGVDKKRPLETLRYLPMGGDGYLSVGGEVRYYFNDWQHLRLGVSPHDSLHHLQQRIRLNADLHVNANIRAFVELGDDREFFAQAVTPPNRDKFDVRQAFIDVTIPLSQTLKVTFRPGRFEMPLGNGKLIGLRDGTNVRYTYQGVRATIISSGGFKVDGFMVKPVSYDTGVFDDRPQSGTHFNGVYSSGQISKNLSIDGYYYDVARPVARYSDGSGPEVRRSFGARLAARGRGFDFDGEAAYQNGHVGTRQIQAWGTLIEGGYTFRALPMAPRIGTRFNVFSGDHRRGDGTIGTFVPPFPRLPLYSDASWFNFSNLINVYPSLTVKPAKGLTVISGPDFFWRQSRNDAVYFGPSTFPLLTPSDGKRFVGTNLNLQADYVLTRNLSLRLFATRFLSSASFRSGGGRSSNYIGYWVDFRF